MSRRIYFNPNTRACKWVFALSSECDKRKIKGYKYSVKWNGGTDDTKRKLDPKAIHRARSLSLTRNEV